MSQLDDLLLNKRRLDDLCDELHRLYDEVCRKTRQKKKLVSLLSHFHLDIQVVPAISDSPAFFTEQQLKREVYDLANEIPKVCSVCKEKARLCG